MWEPLDVASPQALTKALWSGAPVSPLASLSFSALQLLRERFPAES